MAKRFRDTELWAKEWYVALSCAERNAMDYVLCRCDAVGVWSPAFSVAERLIGQAIDWEKLPEKTNGNIEILTDGKWWIRDFCYYQYGKISPESTSKIQQTLYGLLEKHGLWDSYLSTLKPTVRATVEATVLDKELEKEKEKEKKERAEDVNLTDVEHDKLVSQYGEAATKAMYAKLSAYKGAKGRKYRSDYKAILEWVVDAVKEKQPKLFKQVAANEKCLECGRTLPAHNAACSKYVSPDMKCGP